MSTAAATRSGGCLCGAVRYRVEGPLRGVIYCHCAQCRRQSGHFVAATSAALSDIAIEGGAALRWFRASSAAERGFCGTCGSLLFWKPDGEARISIMAGGFDSPSGLEGMVHIYAAEKGDYYAIEDGLPVHAGEAD